MKNQKMLILSLALILTISITVIGCPKSDKPKTSTDSSATLDGKALLEQRCTVCHNLDRVHAMNTDKAGWEKIVDRMIQKGAKLSVEERTKVIDYLVSMK